MKIIFLINTIGVIVFLAWLLPKYQLYSIESNMALNYWVQNIAVTKGSPKIQNISLLAPNVKRLLIQTRTTGGTGCQVNFEVSDPATNQRFETTIETTKLGFDFLALELPNQYQSKAPALKLTILPKGNCNGPLHFPSDNRKDQLSYRNLNIVPYYQATSPLEVLQTRVSKNTGLPVYGLWALIAVMALMLTLGIFILSFVLLRILDNRRMIAVVLITFWLILWCFLLLSDKHRLIDYAVSSVQLVNAYLPST